jgi:hypothetical protein
LIVALALLACAIALCANRHHNGDVYLQLATGRFLTEHGLVSHDPFSTLAGARPWYNQQWLAELVFSNVERVAGLTGLTVFYAFLLGLPLAGLLWSCRRKGLPLLLAGVTLYIPALLAIVHPRAAAFSLLGFSLLTVIVLRGMRSRRALVAIPVLFAVWANLHGGFVAGLLFAALVAAGLAVDRLRRVPRTAGTRRVVALVVVAVAGLAATLATPLGPAIWSYLLSFRNPALSVATTEWGPVFQSIPATLYLAVAGGFAVFLWRRGPAPRPITPLAVTAGFVIMTVVSLRNIIFIPPAFFFQLAHSGFDRPPTRSFVPAALAATAAVAAALVWGLVLGPAREPPYARTQLVSYAIAHPPRHGRIAATAGMGSYLLWRSPTTSVAIDGWLEHFTPTQLRGTYELVDGRRAGIQYATRWNVGAVITRHLRAVRALKAHGFVLKAWTPHGAYLVREGTDRPGTRRGR